MVEWITGGARPAMSSTAVVPSALWPSVFSAAERAAVSR